MENPDKFITDDDTSVPLEAEGPVTDEEAARADKLLESISGGDINGKL